MRAVRGNRPEILDLRDRGWARPAGQLAVMAAAFGALSPPFLALEMWPRALLSAAIVGALGFIVWRHAHALAEREARMRSILHSAQDAFVSWNAAGTITGWNRQAELLFGYTENEAIGRPVVDTIVPERLRAVARDDLERLLDGAGPSLIGPRRELVVMTRDGSELPVELTTTVVATSRGVVFNAFLHDISQRRRAEQRLRDSVLTLEVIAGATHALSISTDPNVARTAICDAAREVARAPIAMLVEPQFVDGFVITASSGIELPEDATQIPGLAGAAEAYRSGAPVFVADARSSPLACRRLVAHAGIASMLLRPVDHAGDTIGVLMIAWREPHEEPPETLGTAIELLAMHAAAAIDRSRLLIRLDALARTDALTGLPNRREWDAAVPRGLERARRDGQPLSVAMLDMDHFGAYNTAHGHPGGDRLLKAAAAAWRMVLRDGDTLARCGGEEFGVILPAAGVDEAFAVVERMRAATPGAETCSAGIAVWDGAESAPELVARADEALYAAKQTGRDRTLAAPLTPGAPGRCDAPGRAAGSLTDRGGNTP